MAHACFVCGRGKRRPKKVTCSRACEARLGRSDPQATLMNPLMASIGNPHECVVCGRECAPGDDVCSRVCAKRATQAQRARGRHAPEPRRDFGVRTFRREGDQEAEREGEWLTNPRHYAPYELPHSCRTCGRPLTFDDGDYCSKVCWLEGGRADVVHPAYRTAKKLHGPYHDVPVRGNPGKVRVTATMSADDVRRAPGYAAAAKGFKKFHGHEADAAVIVRVDDGKPGVTRKCVYALGEVPETHYTVPWDESNKSDAHWVHPHPQNGMPLEIMDPETGLTSKIPGPKTKVTDWWHG